MTNVWYIPFRVSCHQFRNWLSALEISLRVLARNPEIYDEPQSFRPERLIEGKWYLALDVGKYSQLCDHIS